MEHVTRIQVGLVRASVGSQVIASAHSQIRAGAFSQVQAGAFHQGRAGTLVVRASVLSYAGLQPMKITFYH